MFKVINSFLLLIFTVRKVQQSPITVKDTFKNRNVFARVTLVLGREGTRGLKVALNSSVLYL